MSRNRLSKIMLPCVMLALMFAIILTGCSSKSDDKLIDIQEPVQKTTYYINDGTLNQYYQDHTTKEQAVDEFATSIESLRSYLDGESFVDTGYYMGVNYAIDLLDEQNNTAGNFQLRVHAYLFTFPYEDEDGHPIYKYYENGKYYDENNPEGTRKLVNALEIHNEAIKKSDISIEWYNGATNEVMIGLYFDGLNSNSDDPGNILYVDIQGARRSFPDFGDTVLYQQLIRLLVHLSVEGLLSGLGLQSDAGTNTIRQYMPALVGESFKRVVNDDIISLLFYNMNLPASTQATNLIQNLFRPFDVKWDPLTYKYLGFRFSSVGKAVVQNIFGDMQSIISPDKEGTTNVLTNALFHLTGVVRAEDGRGAPYNYTCDATFDYGWTYPESGLDIEHKDWYKPFEYGQYEFKGKLYVPAWDAQYDALIRSDMNTEDNTTNNVFIEFRDIANGELAMGIYYKNERSYLDITGLEYMYGWIDLEYLGFPQVYDEHIDLAYSLRRFKIMINNIIVKIVDGILDPASSDKKNHVLEEIINKTFITEKIEFTTEQEAEYRSKLLNSAMEVPWEVLKEISEIPYGEKWEGMTVKDVETFLKKQYDANYIREFIEEKVIYPAVLIKKQESLFSANTETLLVDIELIKVMLKETGAGIFTTRQLINIVDSVLPYTLDQLAIMLGIPSAELMVEKTYFTFTLDVDTNLMTMIMYTNLGVDLDAGEPSNMLWKLELTPTHFGEHVTIADVDFSKFKPLEQIYTYSGTLSGNFVFSSQETVDISKLLSATFGESSGLNTPYVLNNNAGLHFDLIYDQFVTDNYVNDEGKQVSPNDPTAIFKEEGRSAFDLTMRLMGVDGDDGIIIRLSSDSVSFNNEVYKKLNSNDPKEKSDAEHAMGYIWVHIPCVKKNGEQAIPKLKVREDVFMASMTAYMKGETAISDNVSSFADNDFNLSLTSIISALCKDAYVVPEPEQLEITSSNDTLQSLFRVKGLIGNIKVDAGFTYRVKGLQAIKPQYYLYQVGVFKDITGENPYTVTLHETLRTHFYQDYRDQYEPLDYDFYVFTEDIILDNGTRIEEGTIKVFELGAKKYLDRQPISKPSSNSFFSVEPAENQDIELVRFSISDLEKIVKQEQGKYFYTTYYGKNVEIGEEYIERDTTGNVYIKWQGLRDIIFYQEGTRYYYFDREMALAYEETDEEAGHYMNEPVYIYKEQYRKLLFEYDPDSVEITAFRKTQYSPRTNGSFMGQTRRYYLILTADASDPKLGALHSVYYGGDETTFPPQYYNDHDKYNAVEVYDDDGKLTDWYYDPIALFVMEPAEPLITEYLFRVCTDHTLTTGIEMWTPENKTPHVRSKWENSDYTTFPCRFLIDWDQVTLKGYFVITEVIVAEGTMGETVFPCRIIVTNREVDTEEYAVVYDKDNYVYRVADSSVAVPGEDVPDNTYYVLSGDEYVLTTDSKFIEGTVYYELKYYEANVPVVDSINIDPYEYMMAKYAYLSDVNNFSASGISDLNVYQQRYKEAELRFINAYFSKYVFDIIFAWERSELNKEQDDFVYNENLNIYEPGKVRVQTEYIAKSYTNLNTNEKGVSTLTEYDWSFDVYEYGSNSEKLIKPAGGSVYLHTRFHGQLIALRVDVGVRNFSYVKFNVYNPDGTLSHEDTFDPDKYPDYSGKYTANYYDSSSYVLGTQPTFVFTDDKGEEHEIIFDMSYISGLNSNKNYDIVDSYRLTWSDGVITNVGSEGSYFMEYVYEKLFASDSETDTVRKLTEMGVVYDEYLTDEQKAEKVLVGGWELPLYSEINGYAKVLRTTVYSQEFLPMTTYKGERISYSALSAAMLSTTVTYYDENLAEQVIGAALYKNVGGYAFKRASYSFESEYVDLIAYGYMPMGSDNYSLPITAQPVSYNDTGSNLALTEEQRAIKVVAEGYTKALYADNDRDGYAEKLNASVYHDSLFDLVTTYTGEIVPYKSLTEEQKVMRCKTESGSMEFLYRDVDGHAEKRRETQYSSIYAPYTLISFVSYTEFSAYYVNYADLTATEKATKVTVVGGNELPLYIDEGGYAKVMIPVYKNETERLLTVNGERVFYARLSEEMKKKTVDVDGVAEKQNLYSEDPDGYALRLKIDHYPALYEYESLIRFKVLDTTSVDHDAAVLLYTDFYDGNLFRFNEKTGKVEIRRASVYLPNGADGYYLPLTINGVVMERSVTKFSYEELYQTVVVSGEEEEQYYIVDVGGIAAIRIGYWYTENEWEEFSIKGVTFDSLDALSPEMRNKKVYVRLKDYEVELFRINDGKSDLLPVVVSDVEKDYADLSDEEKNGDVFVTDRTAKAFIPAGGYYIEDEWQPFTVGGIEVQYSNLSDAMKNKKVKRVRKVSASVQDFDFIIDTDRFVVSEEDYLFRSGAGGVAEILRLQKIVEIRRAKQIGTGKIDLILSGSSILYADLSAKEKASGLFGESVTHTTQLNVGGFYYDEWDIFTARRTAFVNMLAFTSEMQSASATIRPDATEGKLYKGNEQGYALLRDRSFVNLTDYFKAENLWVEYGKGRVALFNTDAYGVSVRSDDKKPINRPFYVYREILEYDENGSPVYGKSVYIGNEYNYEYQPAYDQSGQRIIYEYLSTEEKDEFVVNQAGDMFPTYIPEEKLTEDMHYNASGDHTDLSAFAYKRIDISLNSDKAYEVSTATVNFYSLFRLYCSVNNTVYPLSVVTGKIIENERPGESTLTEYQSVTVRVLVECPKQDPLVLSEGITDELDGGKIFYASNVTVGSDATGSSVRGYYRIDPLRAATAVLPDEITVYFEGGNSHVFSGLEWYAYYDEGAGIGYGVNASGREIVRKQEDGTYIATLPFDEEAVTKVMTRIGNRTSGYKYITVALQMLSKNPLSISFYKNVTAAENENAIEGIEQFDVKTHDANASSSTTSYYRYYVNTFTGIELPGAIIARFSTHDTEPYEVTWKTTTGEDIVYKPNTTLYLYSDIREWKTVTYATLEKMTWDEMQQVFDGWYIYTLYSATTTSTSDRDKLFLGECIYNESSKKVEYTMDNFASIRLYKKVDLQVYLDIVIGNYSVEKFVMPSRTEATGSIFSKYVLVCTDEEQATQELTYDRLRLMDKDEMQQFRGWLIDTITTESGIVEEGYRGVTFLSQCTFSSEGTSFRFGEFSTIKLIEDDKKYVLVSDLVRWESAYADRVGLYYVDESGKNRYIVISSGSSGDKNVAAARIGIFNAYEVEGEVVYSINETMTVQNFINTVYNKADIELRQNPFDYSMPYAQVETYQYNELDPDDKDSLSQNNISLFKVTFSAYDRRSDKATFDFNMMTGSNCINVVNGYVKVYDVSGTIHTQIAFADLLSMAIANELKTDIRTWSVISVTQGNVTVPYPGEPLSNYSTSSFGSSYSFVTLRSPDGSTTKDCTAEELEYRLKYLAAHVSVADNTTTITGKSIRIEDLSVIMNINDMISYEDENGVPRQLTVDKYTYGKYLIALGTGLGAYDMNAVLIFRGGYYYNVANDMAETIVIDPYDGAGNAKYASGYIFGDSIQITLNGVRILEGGAYTGSTTETFVYGPAGREQLSYWYVLQNDGLFGLEVGTLISQIPAEIIYRTGSESGGRVTLSTITKEGFYIIRTFRLEGLPDYIDDDTTDRFDSVSGSSAELFVIENGEITIDNIYEYDNGVGMDSYFKTADYLPRSLIVTIGGTPITVNNVVWTISETQWSNVGGIYDRMNYKGTEGERRIFADAKILGYRPTLESPMQNQIRLTVKIKIASTEVETLSLGGDLNLNTDAYFATESERRFIVYVDPYNDSSSSAFSDNAGEFILPTTFRAYTVGSNEPFTFTDVTYSYGMDRWVTKIYYNVKGIDLVRMTAPGAELESTGITDVRALNIFANIGKSSKTRQQLNVTFYFYDKEAVLTEAVLSVSDERIRSQLAEILAEDKSAKQESMLNKVNVKRVKYNLESMMSEAQKLQSDIVNNRIPSASAIMGSNSISGIRDILLNGLMDNNGNKILEGITEMLYESVSGYSDMTDEQFYATVSSFAKNEPWSRLQCHNFALYYLKMAAESIAEEYATLMYNVIAPTNLGETTKYNNIEKLRTQYAAAYAERSYNAMIQAYMEIEFTTLFTSYMTTDVNRTTLNGSISYKNAVEGLFDTEELLENVRKLNRLAGRGVREEDLMLYAKQFDFTNTLKYGYFDTADLTLSNMYKALFIEQIYKAIYAADVKFGIRDNGRFKRNANKDLIAIRQTVIETLFARMGIITGYTAYTLVDIGAGVLLGSGVYHLDENGIIVPAEGSAQETETYFVVNTLKSKTSGTSLVTSGAYASSSYKMVSGREISLNGFLAATTADWTTREMRSSINAVVERWFDFTEKDDTMLADFLDLPAELIRYSFTSIERYDTSIYTIRRSLINGTDFTATLNNLISKGISGFLNTVYIEEKTVTAIRQARALNKEMDTVYVLPSDLTYRKYLAYYSVEKGTLEDFLAGNCYEAGEENYFFRTKDTEFNTRKVYYKFVLIPTSSEDEQAVVAKPGEAVLTEKVYTAAESMTFENGKYYRFVPVNTISDPQEQVYQVGAEIPTYDEYYQYNNGTNLYVKTTDTVFGSAHSYYRFVEVEEGDAGPYYAKYGEYYRAWLDGRDTGTKYLQKEAYVVSTAETVTVRTGADGENPISGERGIGYYPRILTLNDENEEVYQNATDLVYEYYVLRADGKFYLTKDTSFVTGHAYYAKLLLRKNVDYTAGEKINVWEENRGYLCYVETEQSAAYLRTALYSTDAYYLYNLVSGVYNVEFDEEVGGPSYRQTIYRWQSTGKTTADYRGGNADQYYDMTDAVLETQQLNQKLEIRGHVLDEADLIIRDKIAEMALAALLHDRNPLKPAPDTTGYTVTVNGLIVDVGLVSTGKKYRTVTFRNGNSEGEFILATIDGFDTEGYLMYRFTNEYDEMTKKLIKQYVSVFNPFEFKQSDLPSVIKVGDDYLDIVWKGASILPTGNLTSDAPSITGNIVNASGQEVSLGLYVAAWNYAGLYQPTTQVTNVTHRIGTEASGGTTYFVYLNPITGYFSDYATCASVDCYLVDFSIRIMREDGSIAFVQLGSNGTVTYYADGENNEARFIKKLFYPYSSSVIGGVNYSSKLLEYGAKDNTMQTVLNRKNYLLYWDETTLASMMSDSRHASRTGYLSLGNERIGSSTLARLRASGDTTTPVSVTYSYESMSVSTLQLMPDNVIVTRETDADGKTRVNITMPYYNAVFTISEFTSGTCSEGHALTITAEGGKYRIRCSRNTEPDVCRLSKHVLLYDPSDDSCQCVGNDCQCALYREFAGDLAGKSGQVLYAMDIFETFPESGTITLNENNVKYDMSELRVRFLWNRNYETVIGNLKAFVKEMYPTVDDTAREVYAMNLIMNWTKMSESEKSDVIALAVTYCKNMNAALKNSYTEEMAKRDAYALLAINERYDFVSKPERLSGGGDSNVNVTVLVLAEGSSNVYSQLMSVKVIFNDFTPQGYYVLQDRNGSLVYELYTARASQADANTHFEEVTATLSMHGRNIPQNTYFVPNAQGNGYVLTDDTTFVQGKKYYRLTTDTVYVSTIAEYWRKASGLQDTDQNIYSYRGQEAPYDSVGENIFKMLDYAIKARSETDPYEPEIISGYRYRMVQIDNIYWTYNETTRRMTSSSFTITVDGRSYTITSTLLTMTLN